MYNSLFFIVNFMLGVPFLETIVRVIRIKLLRRVCTLPVRAVIKRIGTEPIKPRGSTTYYQVLEFEHYGGTHTVKGHSSHDKMELGREGQIVELLIDPNDGERYVIVTNSDEGIMTALSIGLGIMLIAADYYMISAMK